MSSSLFCRSLMLKLLQVQSLESKREIAVMMLEQAANEAELRICNLRSESISFEVFFFSLSLANLFHPCPTARRFHRTVRRTWSKYSPFIRPAFCES